MTLRHLPDGLTLAREYVVGGLSLRQLADRHGASFGTIRNRLLDAGVELRNHRRADGSPCGGAGVAIPQVSYGEMARLYAQGWGIRRLSYRYGVSASTIANHLRRAGVTLRPAGRSRRRPEEGS